MCARACVLVCVRAWGLTKETYIYEKETYIYKKETYFCDKRDLPLRQKTPTSMTKETYVYGTYKAHTRHIQGTYKAHIRHI